MLSAHLLASLAFVVLPVLSAASHRTLQHPGILPSRLRLSLYAQTVGFQLALAAGAWWVTRVLAPEAVAAWWSAPVFSPLAIVLLAGSSIVLAAMVLHERRASHLPSTLEPVRAILPRTFWERRAWLLVSLVAGTCEEVVWRGFLFWYLGALLPVLGDVGTLSAAAVVFGVAHAYQGFVGMLGTALGGLLLGALYLATGSLWLPMILHVLTDARIVLLRRELLAHSPALRD